MNISDIEMKDMVFDYLKETELVKSSISGRLYKDERPLNSEDEDIVISVVSNLAGQIEDFILNINLFVADIKRGDEYIENTNRLRLLAGQCIDLLESVASGRFHLKLESQSVLAVNNKYAHCISNKVAARFYSEDYSRNV